MIFGISTINDCFQPIGMRPHWRERLNRVVTDDAILIAVNLSMRAEVPSGPVDLDVFWERYTNTLLTEQEHL